MRSEELHEVYEILNRITLKLRDLGFLPSCGTCHINKPTSFYEYHGQLMNMCDDCRDAISTQAEEIVEDSSRGIIGAVAGALIRWCALGIGVSNRFYRRILRLFNCFFSDKWLSANGW